MPQPRFPACLSIIATILLSIATPALIAQVTSARLEGFVRDPSEAVVPGVTVVATNKASAIAFEAMTNESGFCVLAKLPPGRYEISAEVRGFKRYRVSELILEIGDTRSLDIRLETGEPSETVVVEAPLAAVDAVSVSFGSVVNTRQIEQLPLVDRNPLNLFYLQPGANRFGTGIGGVSDGLRNLSTNVTVEGINAVEPGLGAGATASTAPVPIEAVAEYRVATSNAEPEYGRGAGAQVQILYRSGGNQFRGSLFDFHRNKVLNANAFFNNRTFVDPNDKSKGTLPRPTFLRNQFGGSVGGPIIRNRLFFHFTYEGIRQKTDSTQNALVYTPTLKSGNFRYYTKGANSVTLVDSQGNPKGSADDIGNIDLLNVDPNRRGKDPSGLFDKLAGSFPAPNNYDIGDGFNLGGFRFLSTNPSTRNMWVGKFDFVLTSRHRTSVSLANSYSDTFEAYLLNGYRHSIGIESAPTFVVALNSSFTSRFLNELRVGGTKRVGDWKNGDPDRLNKQGIVVFFGLLADQTNLRGHPKDVITPNDFRMATLTLADNATWIRGNHSFRGGIDVRINRMNYTSSNNDFYLPVIDTRNSANPASIPALPGLASADRTRAAQLTKDLTGTVGQINQFYNANSRTAFTPFDRKYRRWRAREYGFFFQDTWKFRPNLTLIFGLRYELMPPAFEAAGLYSHPIGGVEALYGISHHAETQIGLAPADGKVYPTDLNNLGPSIGINWSPGRSGNWSISGSYRIAYDRTWLVTAQSVDNLQEGTSTSKTLYAPAGMRLNAVPSLFNPATGYFDPGPIFAPKAFDRQGLVTAYDPHCYIPYTGSWSLRIQRRLMRDTVLTVAYVGNKATGLPRALNLNQLEVRENGFLAGFLAAQRNLSVNGDPLRGEATGVFGQIWNVMSAADRDGQAANLRDGIVAGLANFVDQTSAGSQYLQKAGLPLTFFRANPQFDGAYLLGNNSNSTWNGLKIEVARRFRDGLHFGFAHTFSKALTDFTGSNNMRDAYRDNKNRGLDKSFPSFDATHVVNANFLWEIPVGRGRRWFHFRNPVVDGILGGWQINGIFNYSSGLPLTIGSSRKKLTWDDNSTADCNGCSPSLTSKIIKGDTISVLTDAEKKLFTDPAPGSAGTTAPLSFRGPGFWLLDTSVFKSFPLRRFLGEWGQLQARFEFFNTFNKALFGAPNASIASGQFGVVSTLYAGPRIAQVALKLLF